MPNRLIRDGLLESEAVLSLTIEARWLYIAICLTADDMGLFEATEFKLARRADLKKEHIERLLSMLNDVDLIRLYSDGKKSYGIIPKFKQRLQIKRIKYPIPPEQLYLDDEDAIEKFNKLKTLASKTTVVQQIDNSCLSDVQRSEPEPEPEPELKNNKYIPLDVDAKDFKEYLAIRKKHKKGWTDRIEKRIREEGHKLGWELQKVVEYCIEKQWANFEASWVKDAPVNKSSNAALAQLFMSVRGDDVKQIT